MHENGISEEAASEHIWNPMREAWKKVNVYRAAVSPLYQTHWNPIESCEDGPLYLSTWRWTWFSKPQEQRACNVVAFLSHPFVEEKRAFSQCGCSSEGQ